jgi:hypothetical protein
MGGSELALLRPIKLSSFCPHFSAEGVRFFLELCASQRPV